jgi:hypothetical protein
MGHKYRRMSGSCLPISVEIARDPMADALVPDLYEPVLLDFAVAAFAGAR